MEASFLDWENASDSDHMQIGGVMVFDPSPNGQATPVLGDLRERINRRLDLVPRFRERLSAPRITSFSRPSWEPDPDFDITRHLRRETLPPPGDEPQFLDWVGDLFSHRLNLSRPLWEVVILDGLTDGRWAMATKVHHCLIDGIGGASVAVAVLLDHENMQLSDFSGIGEKTKANLQAENDRLSGIWNAMDGNVEEPAPSRRLTSALRGIRKLTRPNRITRAAAQTSLKVPIGPKRRVVAIDVPLERIKTIKNELGGTVNDVLLASTASGLRHLFEQRGEVPLPEYLRTMVPVNRRLPNELLSVGVRVSALYLDLPLGENDALCRYDRTVIASHALKRGDNAKHDARLMDLAGRIPPLLQRLIERALFRTFDIAITNVPGPRCTLYCMGSPMRRFVPIGPPLSSGYALNVSVFSYGDNITYALLADPVAIPDLDVFRVGIEQALDNLSQLAGVPR